VRRPIEVRRWLPFAAAAAAWIASWFPVDVPMVVGVAGLGALAVVRRPVLVVALVAASVTVFAGNAMTGLEPLAVTRWSGEAVLASDPVTRGTGVSVDVRTEVGRMELVAWGPAGRVVSERSAGDVVWMEGDLGPPRSSQQWRHVRARIAAERVRSIGETHWTMWVPNAIRASIVNGAQRLPAKQRPVYTGFVLGDDRGRSDEVTEWFRAAGLSHLLVVSGQNLVFVMVLVEPVLSRLGRRWRMAATMLVLVGFVSVTRFEPSVLRASAMAAVSALAVVHGRPADGRRILAIAVCALILLDPLLTRSIGFQLSVAASAGIVLMAAPIERRLRGPARLRAILAVTIAAQLGVAPVLIPRFGPMPLVAVPANVLVEPVAGLVMMWGSSVGLVAGVLGGPVATVLLAPARLGLWWIIGVARLASSLPPVGVGPVAVLGATVMVGARLALRRRRHADHPVT